MARRGRPPGVKSRPLKLTVWLNQFVGAGEFVMLSESERGVLFTLMLAYSQNAAPLPRDFKKLAVMTGLSAEAIEVALPGLGDWIKIQGEHLRINYVDADIREQHEASRRGKRGAEGRWPGQDAPESEGEDSSNPELNSDNKYTDVPLTKDNSKGQDKEQQGDGINRIPQHEHEPEPELKPSNIEGAQAHSPGERKTGAGGNGNGNGRDKAREITRGGKRFIRVPRPKVGNPPEIGAVTRTMDMIFLTCKIDETEHDRNTFRKLITEYGIDAAVSAKDSLLGETENGRNIDNPAAYLTGCIQYRLMPLDSFGKEDPRRLAVSRDHKTELTSEARRDAVGGV